MPSTYGHGSKKLILSVDCEYLRAVLRKRIDATGMGSGMKNAHNPPGITTYSNFETSSPFPLGGRFFDGYNKYADTNRALFYAPRLHIVSDLAFMPATRATVTDTHIDLSAQDMVIKRVQWSQNGRSHEKVNLQLELDESRYIPSLATILTQPRQPDNRPRPPPPFGPEPHFPPGGSGPTGSSPFPGGFSGPVKGSSRGGDSPGTQFLGQTINSMSDLAVKNIKGITEMSSDKSSSGGTWGVLGQKKIGPSATSDSTIEGFDSTQGQVGSAVTTSDGFALPGIDDPEAGAAGELHSHTVTVRVPDTAASDFVAIDANVTYETITSGGNAELTLTVECVETAKTYTRAVSIAQGLNRQKVTLSPQILLSGASTAGNTLKITLKRTPGQGNDSGPFQTITVHNISLRVRKHSQKADTQTNRFLPY